MRVISLVLCAAALLGNAAAKSTLAPHAAPSVVRRGEKTLEERGQQRTGMQGRALCRSVAPGPTAVDPATPAGAVDLVRGGASMSAEGAGPKEGSLAQTLTVMGYFTLWYALNVVYNIVNKKVLNVLPLPWIVSVVQLLVGGVWAASLWLLRLRAAPQLTGDEVKRLAPIGLFHGAGQAATVLSLGAGAVSFTHIVKALEPFFSAMISAVVFRNILRPQVYATLIPVVGGVSLAVAKELSFSWVSFGCAMLSNLAFALRAVFSKVAMMNPIGKNMSAPNLFAVVTIIAFLMMSPVALMAEGWQARDTWLAAVEESNIAPSKLALNVLLSGLFHYTNNEVMYLALSNVHPITLAVGNTLKRVAIIVASLIVFRNPITPTAAIGSGIGISGVLLYSLTKQYYDKVDQAAKAT